MKIDREKFKKLLYSKGFTQRSLARVTGLSEVTINQYVAGLKLPRADNAKKIAEALGCEIEDLFERKIDLMEITGQESGIVVYSNGNSIICNWSHDVGLPHISPLGTALLFIDAEGEVVSSKQVDNIAPYVGEIIFDSDGSAASIKGTQGTIYRLKTSIDDELIVIAPMGWN